MRVNLNVPFREKDAAKRLGARWDYVKGVWYVENADDLFPFLRWIGGEPEKKKPPKALPKHKPKVSEGIAVRGSEYQPACGLCSVPPWELCACSALLNSREARTMVTGNALTHEAQEKENGGHQCAQQN